jgi:NitT/TauT family transport system ATP-binding protein
MLGKLLRALGRAADYVDDAAHTDEIAAIVARPDYVGVDPELIRRALRGHQKISPEGEVRDDPRYIMMGNRATRPDPVQAAWLYAQMVRWGHAPLSRELLKAAKAVFRTDLYDSILGKKPPLASEEPADHIGAFTGAAFDADDIAGHLSAWKIRRW